MMTKYPLRWLFVVGAIALLAAVYAFPLQSQGKEGAKTETAAFLVVSPHTAEECLAALDQIAATGKDALNNWYWGCMEGDHTGYEIVQATTSTEALKIVPESLRAKAEATRLNKFTAEQVASFHKMSKENK